MKNRSLQLIALSAILAGCTHAAGTHPHDLSVEQHQALAASEEKQAQQHEAQQHKAEQESAPRPSEERCASGKGRVCWTVKNDPIGGQKGQAEEHRRLASEHRAASQTLRDAETRACRCLSDEDRDGSPFAHGADIQGVLELRKEKLLGKSKSSQELGATIVFRATPGLTVEWLQRIVECHLARNSAVGHDMPEMAYCPLVPRGAQAKVRSVDGGFAIDVSADDPASAAEIWRRAQKLSQSP